MTCSRADHGDGCQCFDFDEAMHGSNYRRAAEWLLADANSQGGQTELSQDEWRVWGASAIILLQQAVADAGGLAVFVPGDSCLYVMNADRARRHREQEALDGMFEAAREVMRAMTDEDLARLADEAGRRGERLAQELRESVADLHGGKR